MNEQEQEWARLADAATPGPWHVETDQAGDFYGEPYFDVAASGTVSVATGGMCEEGGPDVGACSKEDAEFIAHARTAVPVLLARLARVEALCDHTEAVIGDYVHVESIRAALAADFGSGVQS